MSNQKIIQKFIDRLGEEDFIPPSRLVEIGLFGSLTGVRQALEKGVLPRIKVTSHRSLIPRESVIQFLQEKASVEQSMCG
ncbi:hypothetical protein [Estrella lausannensis]|uniref:DNA-binding protein n=1 Tax=Estrella lausannensis TaxID=483423 RepID=A0A0H5DT92_9BACT|nr:hypothetical protein [Estrella lausannensis]CRX39578.1 hypothetical protein ELAC_p0001 [Estrella lausannensis]